MSAVRTAFVSTDRAPVVVGREPRPVPVRKELLELFVLRAEEDSAWVHRCGPDQVEATLAGVLGECPTLVPDAFPWQVAHQVSGDRVGAPDVEIGAIVTAATLGVATTGSVVLTESAGQDRRSMGLVSDLHVCVLLADQVVTGVPEAIAALDPHTPKIWVSGPAARGEIELKHVEPLEGPQTLHVVLVHEG